MKTKITLATVAALALGAAPLFAGTVYLPVAMDGQLAGQGNGRLHRTLVWVTNPTSSPQSFAFTFIPTGTDGSNAASTTYTIGPGLSSPYDPVPSGSSGMLEITGPDSLAFLGEMNSFTPGGQLFSSAEIPVVGDAEMVPADGVAHLLVLEREVVGTRTDLGIDNFGSDAADCSIKAFRPDGSQILSTATINVPALGQRSFADAFGILQEPSIDGGRFEISCDQPFTAFGGVYGEHPDFVKLVLPVIGVAGGGAPDPGPGPGPGPGPSGALVSKPGVFFAPVQGKSLMDVVVPIPNGVPYASLDVEFDMAIPNKFPSAVFTGTVVLLRPVKGGTYYAHTIRGDRGKSTLDMGVGERLLLRGGNGVWQTNKTYHLSINYDTITRSIDWRVTQGGQLVEHLQGGIGHFDLVQHGESIRVRFGMDHVYDEGGYGPPLNFRFSNLVITGEPL